MNHPRDYNDMYDRVTNALAALDVRAVVDPDATAQQAVILLLGSLQFRLADLAAAAVVTDDGDADPYEARALYARGWEDIFTAVGSEHRFGAADEAGMMSVMFDLLHTTAHTNAAREQNPYAKAATYALDAAASMLYLAATGHHEPGDGAAAAGQLGATANVAEKLNRASSMFAHAVNGGA